MPVLDGVAEARPVVSVIVAAYNASRTVGETIRSVLAQTRQDFEIVVIDDGSTDDTASILAHWTTDPRIRLHRQENAGPAAARNAGIALARGDYVSMLDSDDLWLPCYLERMVQALQESPESGFAYTDAWALEQASGRIRRATAMSRQHPPERTLPATAFLEALIQRNFIFNAVTVRRGVSSVSGAMTRRFPRQRTMSCGCGVAPPATQACGSRVRWRFIACTMARSHKMNWVCSQVCVTPIARSSIVTQPRRVSRR